jgi:predicted nucleic acid-binding protein
MKKKYLLDTCSLISLKKNYAQGHEQYAARLSSLDDDDEVCASILSIYELSAGANHAPNLQLENDTKQVIQSIRNEFKILPVPAKWCVGRTLRLLSFFITTLTRYPIPTPIIFSNFPHYNAPAL